MRKLMNMQIEPTQSSLSILLYKRRCQIYVDIGKIFEMVGVSGKYKLVLKLKELTSHTSYHINVSYILNDTDIQAVIPETIFIEGAPSLLTPRYIGPIQLFLRATQWRIDRLMRSYKRLQYNLLLTKIKEGTCIQSIILLQLLQASRLRSKYL